MSLPSSLQQLYGTMVGIHSCVAGLPVRLTGRCQTAITLPDCQYILPTTCNMSPSAMM